MNQELEGWLPALATDHLSSTPAQWPPGYEETLNSTLLDLCQPVQEETPLEVDFEGENPSAADSPEDEADPEASLRRELEAITRQLDALPFRQTNKRIYALLKSTLGKDLPLAVREHLTWRTMRNVFDALDANPEVETLFLREHELEMILYKREHADWFAIEGSIWNAEG